MRIVRHPKPAVPAGPDWVTGMAEVTELLPMGGTGRFRVDSVTFAPGSRTKWHRHPTGQVLLVTGGRGLVQAGGSAAVAIGPGSTVWIEPDEWHWHGAASKEQMTHVAIECEPPPGRNVERRGPVTEAQYFLADHAQGDGHVCDAV